MKLAFVGDLTVDNYPKLGKTRLGGSSLTCALWAKKLGAETSIVAAVGNDKAGKDYLQLLAEEKIIHSHVRVQKGNTSSIEIFLNPKGEREFGKWDEGVLRNFHLSLEDKDFLKEQNAMAMPVYFKTKHILEELLKVENTKTLLVVDFDDLSQFQKDTKIIKNHLHTIDIVMVGLDIVSDAEIIRKLQNLASKQFLTKLIVITLNKNGSMAFLGDKVFHQKADKIKVLNSTGAGDAFLAGFLVEYVKSKNVQKSLLQGTKTATKAIKKTN